MKQILLGITGIGPKMVVRKAVQALEFDPATGKVKVTQRFGDPDIDREGRGKSIGEEEHAISDFAPDTRQLHQLLSGDIDRELAQAGRGEFSTGDSARSSEKVWRAESHLAGAQLGFRGARQTSGGWKSMDRSE